MTLLGFAGGVLSRILYIVLAFVVLMFMILIHELGHYTAGKILKFKINEFAVGMGPKLLSHRKKNGELISLRLLPLGGFCAFEGENEDGSDNPAAFNNQKPWKRLIVLFSGAFFNFLSAILIAVIVFSCYGDTVAVVKDVYEYAPAENRLLEEGDVFYKIDGREVYIAADLSYYMTKDTFDLTVLRDGEEVIVKNVSKNTYVTAQIKAVSAEILSGERKLQAGDTVYKIDDELVCGKGEYARISGSCDGDVVLTVISSGGTYFTYTMNAADFDKLTVEESSYTGIGMTVGYSKRIFSFGRALARSVPYCFEVAWLVLRTLGGLLTGAVGLNQVGGPISTIAVTSQVVATGFGNVLSLIVLISVNLAAFNLLPIPALDGCQMLFVLIEIIARKPVNRKVQNWINAVGLIAMLIFVVVIDLLKL